MYSRVILIMSVQQFCHNCGKQVQVGSKFCPACGTNLTSLASTPASSQQKQPVQTFTPFVPNAEDDEDGDSYIDKMTHLNVRQSALQVEIVRDKALTETLGAAVLQGSQSGGSSETYERNKPYQNVDAKTFQEEFKKEAGTLRHD